MKQIITILIVLLFNNINSIFAQNISFFDSRTMETIPGVIVSDTSKKNFVISNNQGKVNLKDLTPHSLLIVQHNYYKTLQLSLDSIDENNNTILLEEITFQLDQLIITANKWEQRKDEIPFSINEIQSKKVSFDNPRTTADLLGKSGKVFIQKSQAGGGSPMIRGFAANSVLIVVDGVRMNNAIFRGGNLQNSINIDPNSLGHTEIIFGPGSVTYGSDALGGVMDFHTKEALFALEDKFDAEFEGLYRANSANGENTFSIDVDLKWKKFSSHTQFSRFSFQNLRAGKNHFGNYPEFGKRKFMATVDPNQKDTMIKVEDDFVMVPSFYNSYSFNQKFRYKPNKNLDITYSFINSSTSNIQRYDRLTQMKGDKLKYAQWYYGPQLWQMHNLRFRLLKSNKAYDAGKIVVAYQHFEESRNDRKFNKTSFRHRTERVNLYTINADFTKKLSNKTNLFYGIETAFNDVKSEAFQEDIITGITSNIQTRYPDKLNYYTSSGIFFNIKHQLAKKVNLMAGLRYSLISLKSEFDTSFNKLPFQDINLINHAPNGSIGIAWLIKKDMQLNINLASGFRAPNLDDVAKVFDSEPGNVVVPNPNLGPEYVYSSEISLTKSFKEFAQIELTAYASYINNLIVRKDYNYDGLDSIIYDGSMSKVQAMQNADNAQLFGGIAKLTINLTKNLSLSSTYNLSKGIDSDNNSLRHIPPNFGNTTLIYKGRIITASFYSNYSQSISFDNLAPSEQSKTNIYTPDGAESWYTLNFNSDIKIYKGIHLNFAVENILDRFYTPYSSGIPAPGRNFILSIRINSF